MIRRYTVAILIAILLAMPSLSAVTCAEQRAQREATWQDTVTACSATFGVTICTWWYAEEWNEIQQDYSDCILLWGM